MKGSITWVGIDAHKKTLAVAILGPDEQREEFTIKNTEVDVRKLARRLKKMASGAEVRACYEAGTCGYTLQRWLEAKSIVCDVIAPSLIPRKAGERIKTDRRDAVKLAELLRAGVLTTVSPPTREQEAIRDLCRCREDVREDLSRCRHRLLKMLVRRGLVFNSTSGHWSARHRRWLEELAFDNEVDREVFAEYLLAIKQAEGRLAAMEKQIERAAELPLYREHVAWLRCFHGINTTIAMIFVAELHGIERFDSPRALAAYLGLVPSLQSSGNTRRAGGITKTGNVHVRRVLVQAAWQYRRGNAVGKLARDRQKEQPERVVRIADAAYRRLSGRYRRLVNRGKSTNKVVIAIARELAGFMWAALRDDSAQLRERKPARHGAPSSTQVERVKASAAPRSGPRIHSTRPTTTETPGSRTAVGQRR